MFAFLRRPHLQTRLLRFITTQCPSCARTLPSSLPVCTSCGSIHPLQPNTTHHALLGLPEEPNPFVVDQAMLKQRFRQAQTVCHPDTWATKGGREQDLAHTLSSRINEAYQTLLRPLSRAEYLLKQHGLGLSEQDQVDDMEFMSEIMDARETIDEAESRDEVEALRAANQDKISRTVGELERLVGSEDWAGVKWCAVRLRYLEGIARAAERWLDKHAE